MSEWDIHEVRSLKKRVPPATLRSLHVTTTAYAGILPLKVEKLADICNPLEFVPQERRAFYVELRAGGDIADDSEAENE